MEQHHELLSDDRIVDLSRRLQEQTGRDSVDDVRHLYVDEDADDGSYICPHAEHTPTSDCVFTSGDPIEMWRHVHFSAAEHGLSFDIEWDDLTFDVEPGEPQQPTG
jgi:hypothetical protein